MSEINKAIRGAIKIYGCGGTGITIGSTFEHYRDHDEVGMARLDVSYIDTSRSNLKPGMQQDKIFIVPGLDDKDGSGKNRAQNAKLIMKHAKQILQEQEPGYLNVFISSASGGTGAVAAAILSNELLAAGHMVINVTVGVADSGAEIENTLDTLKSFEGLVRQHKKTVPVAYFENSKATPMSAVDEKVTELIVALAVMFSRQNEGLDTQDMINFLNVDVLTKFPAHVVGLESCVGELVEGEHRDTITVSSAVSNKDARGIDFVLPYTTFGILPAEVSKEISSQSPLHLVTKAYPFNDIATRLKKAITDMEKAAKASTAASSVLEEDADLEGGFLSLR
jgi:hypothetical protein